MITNERRTVINDAVRALRAFLAEHSAAVARVSRWYFEVDGARHTMVQAVTKDGRVALIGVRRTIP